MQSSLHSGPQCMCSWMRYHQEITLVYMSFKNVFICHNDFKRDRYSFDINIHICDTFAAGYAHMCICICMRICMHMYIDAYVRLWYGLTRWGVVAEIFGLCEDVHVHVCVYVCACMRVYVYLHMNVYVYMCVCVYVCIYMYIQTRVGVHMHSYRHIWLICTVQSLYYMRVYHRCIFNACMRVWRGIGNGGFPQIFHGQHLLLA